MSLYATSFSFGVAFLLCRFENVFEKSVVPKCFPHLILVNRGGFLRVMSAV